MKITKTSESCGIAEDGQFSAGLWFNDTPIYQGCPVGTIGDCKLDDSGNASEFLSQCAEYLHREQGCKTVIGPMNRNTWLQHRLVLESDGRDPFLMEPVEPEYFPEAFREADFSILSQYTSSSIDLTTPQRDDSRLVRRFLKNRVTFRGISPEHFEKDLGAIFDLSLISFANNFLYTPLERDVFIGKYLKTHEHIDPDFVILAEHEGQLIGYVFCMPDLLALQHGKKPALVIKTLAARPATNFRGLGTALVGHGQKLAREKGYTEAIHALQYESNSSLRISQRFDARVFRRYGLMAKSFPSDS